MKNATFLMVGKKGPLCFSFLFLLTIRLLAQCPTATPPSSSPPNSIVTVKVLSVKPNSDLEGDDDFVPFYDNHADIFGKITIDGPLHSSDSMWNFHKARVS